MALGLRLSEENFSSTAWADRRTVEPTDPSSTAKARGRPTLVEALNRRPWEVRHENGAIVLASPRSAHRAPLAQADAVPPPRACRDQARDLAAVLGYRQLERRAAELTIHLGTQHRAHVLLRHAHVAALEHDAQLAHPARRAGAADLDVRDALQAVPAHVHHRRQRPRQYSAQPGGVPLLAPAEAGRDVAVVAAAAFVGYGSQVGPAARGLECLLQAGRAEPARGVEVRVDQLAVVAEHFAGRGAQ